MLDPILSITDRSGIPEVTQAIDLDMTVLPWFTESSARWSVRWSSQRLTNVAKNIVQPQNYFQLGSIVSGFDERSLPRLPAFGNAPVDTNTRVGDSEIRKKQ